MGTFIGFFIIVTVLVSAMLIYEKIKEKAKAFDRKMEQEAIDRRKREHLALMEQINRQLLMAEVMRQSKLVGDTITYEAIMNNTYDGMMPEEHNGIFNSIYPDRLLILSIAGINYRGNLKAYVGDFKGVLIPEPKNDYDPNAIMVKCEDGKHLGYISEEMTQTVRDFIGHSDTRYDKEWRYRITGRVKECDDDNDLDEHDNPRKFFAGEISIVKNNKEQ